MLNLGVAVVFNSGMRTLLQSMMTVLVFDIVPSEVSVGLLLNDENLRYLDLQWKDIH